jgi:hypothetical protein
MKSELLFRFPWFERWAVCAMRWILHLPSDKDTIKFCLAAWHCGWPRVRKASRDTAAAGFPVEWRTIRYDLPCPTVAYVENKYLDMTEEKTPCYEG